eukprot:Colp12_sorted_trinity150504_noHs@4184
MNTKRALIIFALVLGTCFAQNVKHINAKPNGQTTRVEHEEDGSVCKFQFAAVGGTNEDWQITINNGLNECIIERPNTPSYLFFMHFSASFTGAKFTGPMQVEVYGQNFDPVPSSEFIIEGSEVKHKDGSFKGSISAIRLVYPSRSEL